MRKRDNREGGRWRGGDGGSAFTCDLSCVSDTPIDLQYTRVILGVPETI
jgi:hypothetical protein